MNMPTVSVVPQGCRYHHMLHGLELARAIQRGLREQVEEFKAKGRPRLTSMFCIAFTKWENIKARLTPAERIQYQRDGFSSVAYDMPTLEELRAFHEREAQLALEDGEKFEATGKTIGEVM